MALDMAFEDTAAPCYLMLTPGGAWHVHAAAAPDERDALLQSLMQADAAPERTQWLATAPRERSHALSEALDQGWVEELVRPLHAPDTHLDQFLPHAIAGFSSERRAALASGDGFCLARSGFSQSEAETLCASAADFFGGIQRRQRQGLHMDGRAISVFEGIDMLLPSMSFLLFWVAGNAYCLVLGAEPLINNTALVQVVWGLHRAGAKFAVD